MRNDGSGNSDGTVTVSVAAEATMDSNTMAVAVAVSMSVSADGGGHAVVDVGGVVGGRVVGHLDGNRDSDGDGVVAMAVAGDLTGGHSSEKNRGALWQLQEFCDSGKDRDGGPPGDMPNVLRMKGNMQPCGVVVQGLEPPKETIPGGRSDEPGPSDTSRILAEPIGSSKLDKPKPACLGKDKLWAFIPENQQEC
ncbi:hypothetical protein IscW_ISCW001144 [Ixodes scapularis]|uniref:Uncharacterized protein n=1 Tax=Ixodes scapularis TaxID=6945 RepID=B7P4L9_IXOSC|nr:hypothetical protein IscW_ISCW001144 [Ixodes scapularis]|eukprot:XP_002406219.1 hypothetical protein IscW_ISCW001144 [Ixodes scapularis]